MPIYEYTCSTCNAAFTHLARTLADKPEKCPACGAKKFKKQLSTFAPTVSLPKGCGDCGSAPACPAMRSGGCGCSQGGCGH